MNQKAIQAWDLYARMETSAESLGMFDKKKKKKML